MQIGYCFVTRDDWPEWLRANPDIPATADYATWLINIAEFCKGIEAQGGRAIQVKVKPAEFLTWCHAVGRQEINSSARADYAAARMIQLNN